jgi:hypothetical protein
LGFAVSVQFLLAILKLKIVINHDINIMAPHLLFQQQQNYWTFVQQRNLYWRVNAQYRSPPH